MTEWQEISTAPRNRTVILAFDPNWYDVAYPMICNRHGRWVHWFNELGPFDPTHWMPMPAPPLPKEGKS